MTMTTQQEVEDWIHHRGGLSKGLPRLRDRVKAGYLSPTEVGLVKEYLANLDTSKLSQREHEGREARKRALAESLDEPPADSRRSTALVAAVVAMAALAAAFIVR
jgi:hypothetical protein